MRTKESYDDLSNSAISFLEKKYNRDFRLKTYEAADILSSTDFVHCMAEGIDPENESIKVAIIEANGETRLKDNYFFFLIRPQLEKYVSDMVEAEFDEVKVFVENDEYFSNSLTDESTLEDFFQVESSYRMSVNIFIKGNPAMSKTVLDEKMDHIVELLKSSGHSYSVYMFVVNPDVYQSIERYDQEEFWDFYAVNREPDGNQYYYVYHQRITKGEE